MTMAEQVDLIVAFLADIGITARDGDVPGTSFLPGVRIDAGGLVVDRAALASAGDLLHEAGHIAVTPAALRSRLADTLASGDEAPFGGETEAIAWSWATLVHLGLPPEVLFHDRGYRGQAAALRQTYTLGVWPGAFGLAQAGMTRLESGRPYADGMRYPRMERWLRG